VKVKKKSNSIKNRLKRLQRSAIKRNISVDLNEYLYSQLLELGCVYCGSDLMEEEGYCLDRHDNSKGYHFDNVAPCCKVCNRAKGAMTNDDFLNWVNKAFNYQQKMIEKAQKLFKDFNETKAINKIKNSSGYRNSNNIYIEGDR